MAYCAPLPVDDVTDQTLALRRKALQKIGNVRQDEGQLAAALESYVAASEMGAELLRRAPDDPERAAAYAETLNHLGNAQGRRRRQRRHALLGDPAAGRR
jgi:hypothetical protein